MARLPLAPHSVNEFQAQLNLARREGGVRFQKVLRLLVVSRDWNSAHRDGVLRERCGFGRQAVGGDGDSLIVVIEKVEGVGGEFKAVTLADVELEHQTQVGGNVVRSS